MALQLPASPDEPLALVEGTTSGAPIFQGRSFFRSSTTGTSAEPPLHAFRAER